jgi:hypothetical protein
VAAVQQYFHDQPKRLEASTFIWIDIICCNQHLDHGPSRSLAAPSPMLSPLGGDREVTHHTGYTGRGPDIEGISSLIQSCKYTLVVLDHKARVFRRIWCLYEIAIAMQSDR